MIMNILTNPKKLRGFARYVKVDNVSRRSILKGLGLAGGFVLAAPVMSRPAFAAYQTGIPHYKDRDRLLQKIVGCVKPVEFPQRLTLPENTDHPVNVVSPQEIAREQR